MHFVFLAAENLRTTDNNMAVVENMPQLNRIASGSEN